jgi:hypothetical protein
MAELYQVATGSKKISNLTTISGISGSAVIPVVMSNVVGSTYPITNGTTNQISYQDFRESVIENNANIFTQAQSISIGSGNATQEIALNGDNIIVSTGSIANSTFDAFRVNALGNGGVAMYAYDKTEATPANRFKTFLTVGTDNGGITLTRNVITTGNLNVAGNLGLGGNLNINQNLVVGGTITAQSYNTEFISASVIYDSGSTKFGDTSDDNHERTGSLLVSGSSSVIGNSYVSGIVQNALLGAVTSSLITQNISQNGVNLLLSAQTASQGSINTLTFAVTSSLINIVGGLQAYTASLKGQAIVSSSTQIQNYNLFAVTSSGNTFYGNQSITGSLSISAGEFNVTTGSGNMTSSLIFDHTQNDGVTLGLRHNDRLSLADHTFNVNVWAAGVYTTFVRNGTPYTILNVEAFDDNKIYLYRDTRLYNKSLLIDNNLTVTDDAQITGSLIVLGGVTGSLLATNGVVSSSNQLFELNNQTGSQNSVNNRIAIVTASLNTFTASLSTSATNINSFTASQLAVNTLTQAVTSSLITIVGGLQAYTASLKSVAIVSSSNQLFELNNQTGSQNSINTLTQAVTSSLITIVGGIQSYTASIKGAAIVSSSQQIQNYNVFAVTASNNIFYGESSFTNKVTHTNGYIVLTQVSQSLNFADDAGAAAGGVPLGGLYRNGNFIAIRID